MTAAEAKTWWTLDGTWHTSKATAMGAVHLASASEQGVAKCRRTYLLNLDDEWSEREALGAGFRVCARCRKLAELEAES